MIKKLAAVTAAAGAAYAGLGYFVFYEALARNARLPKYATQMFDKKHGNAGPAKPDERVDWFYNQKLEEFNISSTRGQKLCGWFLPADKPSDKFMVCAHGYRSCGKGEFRFIAKFLHEQGINLLLVDHQALGESEGKYIAFGCHEAPDLMEWIEFLINKFGADIQISLYGISMGSATVMMLSNHRELPENVKFIIADCGYTTAEELFEHIISGLMIPPKPILFSANWFCRLLGEWDIRKSNPIDCVKEAKVPMLFIHGEDDDFVPTFMGGQLYNACTSEKDYICIPGAGHAESYQKNSEPYEAKLLEYFAKYYK